MELVGASIDLDGVPRVGTALGDEEESRSRGGVEESGSRGVEEE